MIMVIYMMTKKFKNSNKKLFLIKPVKQLKN
jgi:hypothetical protein